MTATALAIASGLAHAAFTTAASGAAAPAVDPAQATHYVAAVMWAGFASAVVSLIAAAFGGWMGAHHVHRVYHLRQYPVHGQPV
jgi:ABC-type amino acid transport substrate-binding protein